MGIFGLDFILEDDIEVPDDSDNESFTLSDNEDEVEGQQDEPTDDQQPEDEVEGQQDKPTDDQQPEDESENQGEIDAEDDDFTLDSDDEGATDNEADNEPTNMGEPGADDEIRDMENEVMDDLSDQQKNIRDKELKSLYVDLYNSISNILVKVDRVVKTTDNIRTLNYCETRLSKIQDMIYDYLLDVYKTKSYIQNLTMYYMILGTLTGIEQLLKSLTTPINK